MTDLPDLVVLSHLPWAFVYQRPQHLISRLAADRTTWFVEECHVVEGLDAPRLDVETVGPVRRVRWLVPGPDRLAGFDDPDAEGYADAVVELLGPDPDRIVWAYTPMALPTIDRLDRSLLVYDCMDDLASFAHASPQMRQNQNRLLDEADVVFAGGPSIHAGIQARTDGPVHLFRSGVEAEHYAGARELRSARPQGRPAAGYVGVIDERVDLDLVAGLAEQLPEWDIHMVGPIMKIPPEALPQAPNLHYPGMQAYDQLPAVMSGFDVALMPFALNEATRSISPTKTLEYLAAGLPVVSTRIADVVADYGDVVDLQEHADGFADACRSVLHHRCDERDERARPLLHAQHWDTIADRMRQLIDDALQLARRDQAADAPVAVERASGVTVAG